MDCKAGSCFEGGIQQTFVATNKLEQCTQGAKMKEFDVFISYASEDERTVVHPLADELGKRGLSVWYDDDSLRVKDSFQESVGHGLENSTYGIAVLSPAFCRKVWPGNETDFISGLRRILPVRHNVSAKDVAGISPLFDDSHGVSTAGGISGVADAVLEAYGNYRDTSFSNALVETLAKILNEDGQ